MAASKAGGVAALLGRRWRAIFGAIVGGAIWVVAARSGARPGAAVLIGWNSAAVAFLVPTLWVLVSDPEEKVKARAGAEDENRAVIMGIILAAVAASLAAIVIALRESRQHGAGGVEHPAWVLALSASTLVFSWIMVQCLFTLHYAHRYFGDRDNDGTADKGVEFPGDAPRTYRDFIYMAVCIGATCQVSDFDITHGSFRNMVTLHALISFVFNTMVLALGINILGNLMGQ